MYKLARHLAVALAALLTAFALTACGGDDDDGDDSGAPTAGGDDASYMGATVAPPIQMPDAVLLDENGEKFDLQKETEGYITLL